MAKDIFIFRHQSGGFINEFIFNDPPTPQQTEAVKKICAVRYGTKHGKTKSEYWLKVFRLPVLSPHDIISVKAEEPGSTTTEAAIPSPTVSATARVDPPKGAK